MADKDQDTDIRFGMNPPQRFGVFMLGFGIVILALAYITGNSNDIFALYQGRTYNGGIESPLLSIAGGVLFVIYGSMSIAGMLPERLEATSRDD